MLIGCLDNHSLVLEVSLVSTIGFMSVFEVINELWFWWVIWRRYRSAWFEIVHLKFNQSRFIHLLVHQCTMLMLDFIDLDLVVLLAFSSESWASSGLLTIFLQRLFFLILRLVLIVSCLLDGGKVRCLVVLWLIRATAFNVSLILSLTEKSCNFLRVLCLDSFVTFFDWLLHQ